MNSHSHVEHLVTEFMTKLVPEIRESVRRSVFCEILGGAILTEKDGRFYLALPDGRQFTGTRRRDLVLRAHRLGHKVV